MRKLNFSVEEVAKMHRDYCSGLGLRDISKMYGCSQETVVTYFRRDGLPLRCAGGKGKITAKQQSEIKDLYFSRKALQREIAEKYGISTSCVSDIVSGKRKNAAQPNPMEDGDD